MNEICYLCGKEIQSYDTKNKDHVFPKQFVTRKHPKEKGFDYFGILPVHKECNSKFGDPTSATESMVKKSLKLINVLFNPESHIVRIHRENPNIKVLAINSEYLEDFSNKDLEFFKISDVRNINYNTLTSLEFLNNQKSVKPFDKSTDVCLSVLAKSAAAILIKRNSVKIPQNWTIAAYPGFTQDIDSDFVKILGETKPLEKGIKFWSKLINSDNYICIFKFETIVVFFHYAFDSGLYIKKVLPDIFKGKDIVVFSGNNLLDLVNYKWSENFLNI